MVRKETVLVAFMASLLLVASFTICAHATEGHPRMLASEKVVAAVSSSEGYQTSAVEKHAALALAEGTAASGHNKTPRRECGVCVRRVYIYKSRVADQNKL
ncbi:hypothetical protein SADUNF_Sadunf16G0006500 [Salix dunnii]|uniref:Transmembrane protein n=1 Tax=Salix dunnii TaxID=1413687 RepID=A0A835J8F0_9ROSI|nr:hypothetical protein SADUNF_Sadunf16G0006500 [Salix dunnii]